MRKCGFMVLLHFLRRRVHRPEIDDRNLPNPVNISALIAPDQTHLVPQFVCQLLAICIPS